MSALKRFASAAVIALLSAGLGSGAALAAEEKQAQAKSAKKAVSIEATIEEIDKKDRELTLTDEESGQTVNIAIPRDVEEFDKLRVGDNVAIDYRIGATVALIPVTGGGEQPSRSEYTRKLGQGKAAKVTEVVAEVEAVDRENRTVTLRGPFRTLTVRAPSDVDLDRIETDDRVIAAIEEAVAVKVSRKGNDIFG